MRIAFITYEFPPDTGKGGIGTYVAQTAKFLSDNRFEIHVFAGTSSATRSEVIDRYRVHRISCNSVPHFREAVVPYFTRQQQLTPFDCMESPEIGANARELKDRFPDLPLIVRMHAPDHLVESLKKYYVPWHAKLRFFLGALRRLRWDLGYWRKYNPGKDSDCQFTLQADYLTAPSGPMRKWVVKNWHIKSEKISMLPNLFIPGQEWLKIPIESGTPYRRIVFLGRLNVLKGLVNATRAMKRVLTDFPEWQFRLIGEDGPDPTGMGSMRKWMEAELSKVADRVEFTGGMNYEDLPAALTPCEIVLLPSLFESFSYTCAEAMASGKAVVGSIEGGMADMIENNVTGLLANPFRPQSIEDALRILIEDEGLRLRLSQNARNTFLSTDKISELASKQLDFYHSVCSVS